ncbi:hypothetical protein RFI_32179, partial [Reticulomyxa filosa]
PTKKEENEEKQLKKKTKSSSKISSPNLLDKKKKRALSSPKKRLLNKAGISSKNVPNEKKADELIEAHNSNTLSWSRYTKAGLKKQCIEDGIYTTDMTIKQMQDRIGKLKPRINTTYINFVDVIVQIGSYLLWTGAKVGVLMAYPDIVCVLCEVNQDTKRFKFRVFPVLSSQNVSEEITWIMQILDFAKTCGRNEIVLRANDAVIKQKSGNDSGDGNDSDDGNEDDCNDIAK